MPNTDNEFSTPKITPNDNVKIPAVNGGTTGYMENDELKTYMTQEVNEAINAINSTITPIDVKSYLAPEVIPIFGRVINGVAYFCFYTNLSIPAGNYANFNFLNETASEIYPKSNFPVYKQ